LGRPFGINVSVKQFNSKRSLYVSGEPSADPSDAKPAGQPNERRDERDEQEGRNGGVVKLYWSNLESSGVLPRDRDSRLHDQYKYDRFGKPSKKCSGGKER